MTETFEFTDGHLAVLTAYLRPIAHLRQQVHAHRQCIVFGAGAGYDLGFPKWEDLLDRLGSRLSGYDEAKRSADNEIGLGQLIVKLFEDEFETRHPRPTLEDTIKQREHTAALYSAWRDHIYEALYKDVNKIDPEFAKQRSYYQSFVEIIKRNTITITYNFDDSIERYLSAARSAAELRTKRGYTTTYDENSQLPTNSPVIYHPNGFLSHRKAEKPSTHLILSEDSFSEQLTDSIIGRSAVIQSELSQKTCLFIGCSLQDPTLNYLLKRNAQHHPGHFHYYVHWSGNDGKSLCHPAHTERLFELYNLITLNLSTDEIHILGHLLTYPDDVVAQKISDHTLDGMFTYVVTGAVGSGKSSIISHFRSLRQHDEWLEPRLPGMEMQVDKLPDHLLAEIDRWVDTQFAQKNAALHDRENAVAIHILDRGPLDPLAFTRDNQFGSRAASLRAAMTGRSKLKPRIVPAHVILLLADPIEMSIRAKARGKEFSSDALAKQQDALKEAYGRGPGVTIIDTRGLSIQQVVRRVARVVHDMKYEELDLSGRLDFLKNYAQMPLFETAQ